MVGRAAEEGAGFRHCVIWGTAGHSCVLKTLPQPRWEHRVRCHSQHGPHTRRQTRGQCVLGLGWPRPSLTKQPPPTPGPARGTCKLFLLGLPKLGAVCPAGTGCWCSPRVAGVQLAGLCSFWNLHCGSHQPALEPLGEIWGPSEGCPRTHTCQREPRLPSG